MDWKLYLEAYEQGVVTLTETCSLLIHKITKDNIKQLWIEIPEKIRHYLTKEVDKHPRTEDGWSKFRSLYVFTAAGSGEIKEKEAAEFRRGIEVIRQRIENDARYQSMRSHHPNILYMVWDFYDNTAIAYCYEKEQADKVAAALNKDNSIVWCPVKKHWIGETHDS